jgi:hypothetical protein
MKKGIAQGITLSFLLIASTGNAAIHTEQRSAEKYQRIAESAVNPAETSLKQILNGNLEEPAQLALSAMVANAASALRVSGHSETARQMEFEWSLRKRVPIEQQLFQNFSLSGDYSELDLGDHTPLLTWLSQWHDTLLEKTKGLIGQYRSIQDINTLNYALAVVFQVNVKPIPGVNWKTGNLSADRIEYRKHFIPFMNIVTYWVSLEGCKWAAGKWFANGEFLCGFAAGKLEKYMGRHIAWKISDAIFNAYGAPRTSSFASFELADGTLFPSVQELATVLREEIR